MSSWPGHQWGCRLQSSCGALQPGRRICEHLVAGVLKLLSQAHVQHRMTKSKSKSVLQSRGPLLPRLQPNCAGHFQHATDGGESPIKLLTARRG